MEVNNININEIHPIEATSYGLKQNYILPTYDQINFNNYVLNIINSRTRGGIVVADSGIGKTTAISSFTRGYKRQNRINFGIIYASIKASARRSPGMFYAGILGDIGYDIRKGKGMGGELFRRQYTTYLANEASQNDGNLLLFFDEAQNIAENEYYYLMDIINILSGPEIYANVKTILVGTNELLSKKLFFDKTKKNQIVNRFMSKVLILDGINTIKNLELLLDAYDKEMYKGESYTQHYFPNAFNNGCKLSNLSKSIWRLLKDIPELINEPRLTMEDACTLIEHIFKNYGIYGNEELTCNWITEDIVYASIIDTGLIYKLQYYDQQTLMNNGEY